MYYTHDVTVTMCVFIQASQLHNKGGEIPLITERGNYETTATTDTTVN